LVKGGSFAVRHGWAGAAGKCVENLGGSGDDY
jgi:hypothetical protein